uniref:Uncharacterized protein n=1 Tax=Oryza brachyantha TaxID=4533 RepID=J3NCQ3_ORYBR
MCFFRAITFSSKHLSSCVYPECFFSFFFPPGWNNKDASGLHEEAGALRKGKLPWWWDTDYTRSKRRRPIHN